MLSYLVVAALSIGSLIAFGLAGLVTQTEVRNIYGSPSPPAGEFSDTGEVSVTCLPPEVSRATVPRYDYWWAILVANPYVVLADAVPATFDDGGFPEDLFGSIKFGVRSIQLAPDLDQVNDECAMVSGTGNGFEVPIPEQTVQRTTPGWFVGLAIDLLLAAAALVGAWAKTNTPARRLAKGSRIA